MVSSLYLKTIHDKEMPGTVQDGMIRNLGCQDVREIPGGHLAMLSQPGMVSQSIQAFAAQCFPDPGART